MSEDVSKNTQKKKASDENANLVINSENRR